MNASRSSESAMDSDFWEFVSCGKCRMPFNLENGSATVPFWLTECGHVICNNHLSPDQSCCQCGSQGIQLAPLQREMEAPMSEWFRSIPLALDSIAFAAKFQQDALASQVRFHKTRHQQLRLLVERLKRDVLELKKENDILRSENNQYKLRVGNNQNADDQVLNANGKRPTPFLQTFERDNRKPRTDSSPRLITTPLAPNRLTLLPGQQPPELSHYKLSEEQPPDFQFPSHILDPLREGVQHHDSNQGFDHQQNHRPISGNLLQHYSFRPITQQNDSSHVVQTPQTQTGSTKFQHLNSLKNGMHQPAHPNNQLPVRPPTSTRFKPAPTPSNVLPIRRQSNMGPPPEVPQHARIQTAAFQNEALNRSTNSRPSAFLDHRPLISRTPMSSEHSSGIPSRRFVPGAVNCQPPTRSGRVLPSSSGVRNPFFPVCGQETG